MKNLTILFLILFFRSQAFSQTSLKGIQKFCNKDFVDNRERNLTLEFEDSIVFENIKTRFGEFKVNVVDSGKYNLIYTNIFNQRIKKKINLPTKEIIEICVNDFQETNSKSIFQESIDKNKIVIQYNSNGCFHSESEKMIFYKKNDKTIGDFYINEVKIKSKKIQNLDLLIDFERKLRMINSDGMSGCTTVDEFELVVENGESLKFIDDSCDWDGYYELKKNLFNIKN